MKPAPDRGAEHCGHLPLRSEPVTVAGTTEPTSMRLLQARYRVCSMSLGLKSLRAIDPLAQVPIGTKPSC